MPTIATFAEARAALHRYWPSNAARHTHSLERMRRLMEYLGNPQDTLKVIHVAGTSGKTSTAYYAAALLQAAGKTTGLTVSPHVDEINERIQIGLVPLGEKAFCKALSEFLPIIFASGITPTYFELMVAMAYWQFARHHVEYAVVEVGMGGLLDSTNVIARKDKVCVITDIGYDHTAVLGKTLKQIAAQKAGIVQLHNSVFCYRQGKEVMDCVQQVVQQKQADLHIVEPAPFHPAAQVLPLFQQRNFGLALEAVRFTLERDGYGALPGKAIKEAAQVVVPARMELHKIGNKTLVVDVAHNPQKIHTLCKSMHALFAGQPVAVLAGFLDRDVEEKIRGITCLASHLIITGFEKGEGPYVSAGPERVAALCRAQGVWDVAVVPDPYTAYRALLGRPEPVLLVVGSFYLLNHLRPIIKKA
ncbi:MAG TPA: Mur ligase family protein [Candidatus Saccharimonadales bacterium]|nr:Mur ligase family protein [Candidatus Saccharimonadales bacterium]